MSRLQMTPKFGPTLHSGSQDRGNLLGYFLGVGYCALTVSISCNRRAQRVSTTNFDHGESEHLAP
jgi:hypothetical protein